MLLKSIIENLQLLQQLPFLWETVFAIIFCLIYLIYYLKHSQPHFLIKGVYDAKRKNLRKPLPPFPNGWYNVSWSKDIKPGMVKNIQINGHNIVVFRGQDKKVYAMEAYCLHMGANLGIGGQVVNKNCLQCPFHGWTYNGSTGQCVDNDGKTLKLQSIQYQTKNVGQKDCSIEWKKSKTQVPTLKKYSLVQMNGYIYVWIHANEQHSLKPEYPMLDVSKFKDPLVYRGSTQHHINCHIQDIPSNGADKLHFKYVHSYIIPQIKSIYFRWQADWKAGNDPDIGQLFEHPRKQYREFKQRILKQLIEPYPNKQALSLGTLDNWINIPILGEKYMLTGNIIQIGMAVVFVIIKSPFYYLIFHHYIQPKGVNYQHVFHDCFISWHLPYLVSSKISQGEGVQVTNDMYIWQSKSFAKRVYLKSQNESDTLMKKWLQWSSQFYEGCKFEAQKQKMNF